MKQAFYQLSYTHPQVLVKLTDLRNYLELKEAGSRETEGWGVGCEGDGERKEDD